MGNWFGISNLITKVPAEKDGVMMMQSREEDGRRSFDAPPYSPMRIKVRMTKKQLEELKARAKAKADTSRGSSELGSLIVKECLEGKLSPRVVFGQHLVLDSSRSRRLSLSTIDEEGIFASSK